MTRRPALRRPVTAPAGLREWCEGLLCSLREHRLQVDLIPSQDGDTAMRGGCIRAVVGRNPDWYRDLCARHVRESRVRKNPRPDTKISRKRIVQALHGLLGSGTRSSYAGDLLAAARELRDQGAGMEEAA